MPFYERFSAREKAWSTHLFPCLGFGRGLYQARRHQKQETRPCRSLQRSVTCLSSGKVFCCVKSVKVRIGEKYNCHTYPRVQTRPHYRSSIKMFQVTTTVFVLFSPVHTNTFTNKNAHFLMRFCLSSKLKRSKSPKMLMEATVYDAFFGTVFESFHFHLSKLKSERFQNDAFSKGSTF